MAIKKKLPRDANLNSGNNSDINHDWYSNFFIFFKD